MIGQSLPSRSGCQKVRYPTEDAAWAALEELDAKRHRGKKESSAYRCRRCRGWHLTSQGAPVGEESTMKSKVCQECGMLLGDQGEFHPSAFCVLKKAGRDPWDELLWLNRQLGIDTTHWSKRPPLVRDLKPAKVVTHA